MSPEAAPAGFCTVLFPLPAPFLSSYRAHFSLSLSPPPRPSVPSSTLFTVVKYVTYVQYARPPPPRFVFGQQSRVHCPVRRSTRRDSTYTPADPRLHTACHILHTSRHIDNIHNHIQHAACPGSSARRNGRQWSIRPTIRFRFRREPIIRPPRHQHGELLQAVWDDHKQRRRRSAPAKADRLCRLQEAETAVRWVEAELWDLCEAWTRMVRLASPPLPPAVAVMAAPNPPPLPPRDSEKERD